jgi:hypothetical protein
MGKGAQDWKNDRNLMEKERKFDEKEVHECEEKEKFDAGLIFEPRDIIIIKKIIIIIIIKNNNNNNKKQILDGFWAKPSRTSFGWFGSNCLELRTVLPKSSVTRISDPLSLTV